MPETNHEMAHNPEEFVPNPATEAAWRARAHMLQFMNSEPDSQQAEAAREGANREFEEMVVLTQDQLFGSVFSRTGRDEEATKEIIQESYIRAYKGLPKFRMDGQVDAWIHRIAFNQLSNYYKKESKHIGQIALDGGRDFNGHYSSGHEDDFPAELGDYNPEMSAVASETREEILQIVDTLSPKHRKVLVLHKLMGWPHDKIGELMGTSEANSKVMLHRALAAVREKLNRTVEADEETN